MFSLVGLILPLLLYAVVALALYWVIRRAVRDGIRDARPANLRQDVGNTDAA